MQTFLEILGYVLIILAFVFIAAGAVTLNLVFLIAGAAASGITLLLKREDED